VNNNFKIFCYQPIIFEDLRFTFFIIFTMLKLIFNILFCILYDILFNHNIIKHHFSIKEINFTLFFFFFANNIFNILLSTKIK